ncbi:MAG: glycosyltransferase, partial [Candidatus Marinimicrobia bacterium]|nr:glycosyltransferase [Candidatus Neomarinimicrobiota bacterium]
MIESMDISVVIPTFNRKHTLPRAIDSVLSQSISPL